MGVPTTYLVICQEIYVALAGSKLRQLLQPVIEALGCTIWGLDMHAGGKPKLLRIYIDRDTGVVNVDDCERVSRQVSALLDVEDVIQGEYVLEVSSPGIDRSLYDLSQYKQYIGKVISLRLRFPYEGRRNYKGCLKAVEGDDVVLVAMEHEYLFPVASIEKAKLVPQF
jgi:ribosome maturation factor RimP